MLSATSISSLSARISIPPFINLLKSVLIANTAIDEYLEFKFDFDDLTRN